MKHRPLVFLDIETTGGRKQNARITEIGALRVEDGEVVTKFNKLVNPEQPIPWHITKLTGINNEMAWRAPTFKNIADELEMFLSNAILIAHNVNFDYGFIKHEYARIGNNYNTDRLCTAKLSRALYPEHKSHALDKIIDRMNIDVKNRHRAYDDAEVLYKFYKQQLDRNENELFISMNKLIKYKKIRGASTINVSIFDIMK